MICFKPITLEGRGQVGCGQCTNCRINKRREWVGRMLLEAKGHPFSCFVTLTYNEENYPKDGSLCKKHLQKFLKRLRQAIYPRKIRYYAVGEYGEEKFRPHYHLIVFGLSPNESLVVTKCWTLGFVMMGTAEPKSMSYVGYYVQKKMTKKSDPRLMGRLPEFSMMSLRPAIGTSFVERTVESMRHISEPLQKEMILRSKSKIRTEGKMYPLGKTIMGKLKNAFDTDGKEWREKTWRAVTKCAVEEYEMGLGEAERRKKAKRAAAIAISKEKQKMKRRPL